ncbi:hypothetical protein HDU96_006323 [Phlyctochytrium bullatum]|nr:hypothetical protein HDU96_006323 [Phlyctochytrium bullatum]
MSSDSNPNGAAPPLDAAALAKAQKNKEKNEAARKAKEEKFKAKQAKAAAEAAAANEKKKQKGEEKPKKVEEEEVAFVNTTPPGEKKDLSGEFLAKYNPAAVECAWYDWWEKCGYFQPELHDEKPSPKGSFVISIPPPNVTGSLHLGHALTNSIQDTLTRWSRMQGKTALYIPGCDHAGIATQVVVEKKLMRERGITRHALGREPFIKEVWKWKEAYGNRIYSQIKRLGTSVDWSRVAFTMDPNLCRAVNEAFVRLHDEGIIFRANRLVNWCTKLKTAISNLEVENKELEGRTLMSVPDHDPKKKYEFGVIISFAYNVENTNEEIVVATTRIETMLGDTAIAVHPQDERYKHLVGKFVVHPFNNRRIPIIADDYVDPKFGTGCVKITPAHDFNDYAIGKRHNLQFINIFTDDGKVNENGAPFAGLQRFDARESVLKALEEKGLYRDKKDNPMQIPICGRSGNVVEPLMKPQWWVNCQGMAKEAVAAVRNGDLEIIPKTSERDWFLWLENIQDWCISRQLWWGHRVPAYFVKIEGQEVDVRYTTRFAKVVKDLDEKYWVSGRTEEEALEKAKARFKDVPASKITLEQDEDVLDTWFSSGLWPFSILGWPEKTPDFKNFYPNSLLETGWDILFFWVARMVMLGIKLTGQVPFKQVFCHAMVRDKDGRKMSKSLGNVIDPIDVIEGISLENLQKRLEEGNLDPREVEKAKKGQKDAFPKGIAQCGTDALRFTLLAYTSGGRDINLDILRVEGYRKFCNKLWNAARLAYQKLGDNYIPLPYEGESERLTGDESLSDLWILNKLNTAAKEVNIQLEQRNFMQATSAVHSFWLYELCDVYLEICKPVIDAGTTGDATAEQVRAARAARETLYTCLDAGLRMMHPFMPFVTEELWQRLPRRRGDPRSTTIMKAKYPVEEPAWTHPEAETNFEEAQKVVRAARSMLAAYNILKNGTVYVQTSNGKLLKILQADAEIITKALVKPAGRLTVLSKDETVPAGCAVTTISEDCSVFVLLRGVVNFEAEVEKLQVKQTKAAEALAELQKKISAADYESKVKAEVRENNAAKVKALEVEIEALAASIKDFLALKDA